MMRNGILGMFGEIVVKVLSKEDLEDNMKKARESFLDKLEVFSLYYCFKNYRRKAESFPVSMYLSEWFDSLEVKQGKLKSCFVHPVENFWNM